MDGGSSRSYKSKWAMMGCELLGLLCGQPCLRHFPLNLTSVEQSDLVSSCLSDSFYSVGIELMAAHMLGKYTTTEALSGLATLFLKGKTWTCGHQWFEMG